MSSRLQWSRIDWVSHAAVEYKCRISGKGERGAAEEQAGEGVNCRAAFNK